MFYALFTHYRSLVRKLLYLTAIRPDIIFTTNLLSKFMNNPSHIDLEVAKRVVRYIESTIEFGIKF